MAKHSETRPECAAKAARWDRWIEENRPALEEWNRYVEKNGLPLAKYRMF